MSETELQAILARLYTNAAFRHVLRLDAERALAGYFLTAAERAAVLAIDWVTLDGFAASLKVKRRGRLERSYPALFALDAPPLAVYYDRYHEVYPLRPDASNSAEALQFGEFMEQTLADGEPLAPYVRELVRFENTLARLRRSVQDGGTHNGDEPAVTEPGANPRRAEGVAVERFGYNVSEIDDALREGREPEVRNEEEVIVYVLRHGDHDPRILRVSGPTALVVELCDGERSVSDIVAAVEAHYGQSDLRDSVVGVIGQLSNSAILEVADDA